jgi:hypothetical protein
MPQAESIAVVAPLVAIDRGYEIQTRGWVCRPRTFVMSHAYVYAVP